MGKVYLTGAGPGDIELLTIKALRVIKEADCIIYDRLISKEILKYAKRCKEFIYVGKEDKKHILPQDEINKILIKKAKEYKIIVRLKGGDPFVFGRGGEEAIFLKENSIEFEVIPGVTSAVAVPAYAGIPVTHRGLSASFRVVTGHEAKNKESNIDWNSFKYNETIIFLMGYHRLKLIVEKLLEIGKDSNTPIAVISNGTKKEQKVIVGNLSNIIALSKNLKTPVLIIVGDVVKLHNKIDWFR